MTATKMKFMANGAQHEVKFLGEGTWKWNQVGASEVRAAGQGAGTFTLKALLHPAESYTREQIREIALARAVQLANEYYVTA